MRESNKEETIIASDKSFDSLDKNSHSKKSRHFDDNQIIILFSIFIIISLISYIFYELNIYLIAACASLSVFFSKILSAAKAVNVHLNSDIKKKYLYLYMSLLLSVILLFYIFSFQLIEQYDWKEQNNNIIEYKAPGDRVKYFDLNKTHNEELKMIFPQLGKIPFCGLLTYETNGDISLDFPRGTLDDVENYIMLKFRYDYAISDSNSGLIFGPLISFDATEFELGGLSFLVKGKRGGERFGIGIKDIHGHEDKVDAANFMHNNRTTVDWQCVFIPLSVFKNVTLSELDVITLYSNGEMYSGEDYQIIYVSNFAFNTYKNC